MKKTIPQFLSIMSSFMVSASAKVPLVPCGPGTGKEVCEFCDFFILFNNILTFIFKIIPFIAIAFLIVAGIMLYFSGARPALLARAKSIITTVIIGIVVILSSWVIVNTFFDQLGIIDIYSGWEWWKIECP